MRGFPYKLYKEEKALNKELNQTLNKHEIKEKMQPYTIKKNKFIKENKNFIGKKSSVDESNLVTELSNNLEEKYDLDMIDLIKFYYISNYNKNDLKQICPANIKEEKIINKLNNIQNNVSDEKIPFIYFNKNITQHYSCSSNSSIEHKNKNYKDTINKKKNFSFKIKNIKSKTEKNSEENSKVIEKLEYDNNELFDLNYQLENIDWDLIDKEKELLTDKIIFENQNKTQNELNIYDENVNKLKLQNSIKKRTKNNSNYEEKINKKNNSENQNPKSILEQVKNDTKYFSENEEFDNTQENKFDESINAINFNNLDPNKKDFQSFKNDFLQVQNFYLWLQNEDKNKRMKNIFNENSLDIEKLENFSITLSPSLSVKNKNFNLNLKENNNYFYKNNGYENFQYQNKNEVKKFDNESKTNSKIIDENEFIEKTKTLEIITNSNVPNYEKLKKKKEM